MNRISALPIQIALLLIATIAVGCRPAPLPAVQVFPASPASSTSSTIENEPHLLRIRLTISSPSELLVRQGDRIQARALLTDRRKARERLRIQIAALETAAHHLRAHLRLTDKSRSELEGLGSDLPPASFATELAGIRRAETTALAVDRKLRIQEGQVAGVAFGATLTAEQRQLIADHEEAKLGQARDEKLLALSEIEWHKARLIDARDARAYEEKRHRVEIVRQILAARGQKEQTLQTLAQLSAQTVEARLRLEMTAEVRAPFGGRIKRIDWEEMNDERIIVALYLAPDR